MIRIRNLTKKFGELYAVKNLNMDIGAGEIFGFIGPNGAGKTTTIRMLSTLLDPDEGTAWIDGYCIQTHQEEVRRKIGYMPDYFGVYEGVTVWEYLEFFARAYKVPAKERNKIIDGCMALTDFTKLSSKLVSTLSKGMTQRLCLAKTLLHDPKVLILDEPASGLDPRARIEIRTLLKELSRMGKTIFLSSHILTELADVVDSIGILEKGSMVVNGNLEAISKAISSSSSSFTIFLSLFQGQKKEQAKELLEKFPNILKIEIQGDRLEIQYAGKEEEIYQILKHLTNHDIPITGMSREEKNLEDIFMQLTKGEVS
ncbi:MAG: ABC transporter ATP-binding protein [Candidatus Brocadiae bacterium]|nr:ABC transporter ATP-binding protein [Candidatus Brocadiia bacterium]